MSSSSQPPQTSISTSTAATTVPHSSHVHVGQSTSTTDQRQSQSGALASQITAMAISPPPQVPPNSSPLPTTSSSASPSTCSYTAHPGTTGIVQHQQHQHRHDYTPSAERLSQQQQQQHGYPPCTGEVTTMANSSLPPSVVSQHQHSYVGSSGGSPSASSALQQQHGYPSPSPSPSHPPPPPSATGQVATTISGDSGSSHPPSITAQRISSQQSHAASPDASYGHHHGHHRPPTHPSHAPPPSTTSQMRPNFPPQAVPPNFAHFGPPQHRAPQANPGTTAMTFHPHSHQAPLLATAANQFTTAIPPHVPLSTFQRPTTASPYAAPPRGSAEQQRAMPIGYFPPHPYVPLQHAMNPPPMQQQQQPSVGYPSPSSNFSSRAVHGSVASSCGSSYPSPAGSSPYPPYRPAAVYNQQQPQPMLSTAPGKRGKGEREREREMKNSGNIKCQARYLMWYLFSIIYSYAETYKLWKNLYPLL